MQLKRLPQICHEGLARFFRSAYGNFKTPEVKASVTIIIGVFAILFFVGRLGGFQELELRVYDYLTQAKAYLDKSPKAYPVSILLLKEHDIHQYGPYPFSDGLIDEVIQRIEYFKPRVIGLDIYRDTPTREGTENLINTVNSFNNIIIINKFKSTNSPGVSVMPELDNPDKTGFSDLLQDSDGVVRRGFLYLDDGHTSYRSFGLQLALAYLKYEHINEEYASPADHILKLGQTVFTPLESNDGGYVHADARGYQFLLDFTQRPGSFRHFSIDQLFSGSIDPSIIRDKAVIIGVSADTVKDSFSVPTRGATGYPQSISGTELHGIMANQLISAAGSGQSSLATLSEIIESLLLLAFCMLGTLLALMAKSPSKLFLVGLLGLFIPLLIEYHGFTLGFWIPLGSASFAWLVSSVLAIAFLTYHEKRQKQQALTLFGHYLSPIIAEHIWQQRRSWLQAGRPKPQNLSTTILFSDIKGFTKVTDELEPDIFVDWLNEYLDTMIGIIISYDGIVIRFIGDAILAAFGIPIPRQYEKEKSDDARNAVQCALTIDAKLAELNKLWNERNLPVAATRIGIHSGRVVSGSMGNRNHMEYTIHGDDVNIAARLEAHHKELFNPAPCELLQKPCRILISDSTEKLIRGYFELQRFGDQSKLTGRMVDIYQVCGIQKFEGDNPA
jgi:adenylate cyclase